MQKHLRISLPHCSAPPFPPPPSRPFQNRPVSQVVRLPPERLPGRGDIVAIDAEFVCLTVRVSAVSYRYPRYHTPIHDTIRTANRNAVPSSTMRPSTRPLPAVPYRHPLYHTIPCRHARSRTTIRDAGILRTAGRYAKPPATTPCYRHARCRHSPYRHPQYHVGIHYTIRPSTIPYSRPRCGHPPYRHRRYGTTIEYTIPTSATPYRHPPYHTAIHGTAIRDTIPPSTITYRCP